MSSASKSAVALLALMGFSCVPSHAAKDTSDAFSNPGGASGDGVGKATTAAPVAMFRDCDTCPEMVVLPGGTFLMGSPETEEGSWDDERPQHEVKIARFAVGRYEVTFAEWDACRDAGGCSRSPEDPGSWGRGTRPVIDISWNDAKEYVTWLSRETGETYRLLSESEWEYAARAGARTSRPWGDSPSSACGYANVGDEALKGHWGDEVSWEIHSCGDGHVHTAKVGSYAPNAFGLHDMMGNVWEWVEDCWHDSYSGAPSDGRAWTSGGDCSKRVLRGGSWRDEPELVRSAHRLRGDSGFRGALNGFRIARALP